MKKLILLAVVFCLTSSLRADDHPALSARQALDIAEQDLASRGLNGKLFVASIMLDRPSMFNGATFWFVKWNASIPASNPANREVGMKIRMDGSATRLVKEPH